MGSNPYPTKKWQWLWLALSSWDKEDCMGTMATACVCEFLSNSNVTKKQKESITNKKELVQKLLF